MIRNFELFTHWIFESFVPGSIPRSKYNAFQHIHLVSSQCFELLARIEALVLENKLVDWAQVTSLTHQLISKIRVLMDQLQIIHPVEFMDAQEWFTKISFYTRLAIDRVALDTSPPFLHSFKGQDKGSHGYAWLEQFFQIPNNTPILISSPSLFQYFIEANNLRPALDEILQTLTINNDQELTQSATQIQNLILNGSLPQILANDLEIAAFECLHKEKDITLWTFVGRQKQWTFVGQQTPIASLNILETWKKAIAQKYSPQALIHRLTQGLADEEQGVLVIALPSFISTQDPDLFKETRAPLQSTAAQQRLVQILPLVTELHVFETEGEPLRPDQCRSLHDLVCLCLEQGLAGIFAYAGQPARGLIGIKQIRLEVPVIINSFNLGGGLFPTAAEKTIITMDDLRSIPAWSFLLGLVNPVQRWPGQKNEDHCPPPHYSSYAIFDQFFIHCTLRLGRNLYTVESYCADGAKQYVHFRFKGAGPLAASFIRRQILEQILRAEGFTVRTGGDYLDAMHNQDQDVLLQRSLACLGLLVAWVQNTAVHDLATMGIEQSIQTFRLLQDQAAEASL